MLPTKNECIGYYEECNTPEKVQRHCLAVSSVGGRIGKALNENGYNLNIDLIEKAGMCHDVLRVLDNHGKEGATFLHQKGYPKVSRVIENHMHYSSFNTMKIDEEAILCLADRIVLEDEYVGLDLRMEYVKNKAKGNLLIINKIEKGKKELKKYIKFIETEINVSLDELLK